MLKVLIALSLLALVAASQLTTGTSSVCQNGQRYTVSHQQHKYTLRVDPQPEIRVVEPFGSFEVYKDYTVSKRPSSSSPKRTSSTSSGIAGIVVQCVVKTTRVKDAHNRVYDTTDSVFKFTSGKVPYSNHKYLEYFPVKDAKSTDADSFSTGPIVQYDQDGPQTYATDDHEYNTYKTEGKIVMVGENWFISAENEEYDDLLAMGWIVQTETKRNPANGLNYMPYSQRAYDKLKNCRASNILTHTVVSEWTFDDPHTVVSSNLKALSTSRTSTRKAASPESPTSKAKSKLKGKSKKKKGLRDSSSFRNCPTIVAFPACSCPVLCGQLAIFRFLKSRGLVNCITRLKFPLRGLMLQIILKPPAVRGHPALLSAFLQILGIYRQHCYRQGLLTEALPKKASRTLFS
jgi:hypothetical protein